MQISNLGGLQAYAFGQYDGKWLLVGGRLDGLHQRQPVSAFDVAGNNNNLIVVDPQTKQMWSMGLTSLSTSLQEQLSSTNAEFHQSGDTLFVIGGYGYNVATASRKTFPNLTAINIPEVINAVINNSSIASYFKQITDTEFAVTGGHLKKIDNVYYLLGGNKFDGNYNPMGGGSYTQVYTDAVRRFTINNNNGVLSVSHLSSFTDAANMHRRDYNAVPQVYPNGELGITMFSGVFQQNADLPFLNCVNVESNTFTVNNSFQQYYNHYHCAVLPLYSAANNNMHNIFFGGIAQYYDDNGTMVQDDNVPFVKTIARVTRNSAGVMTEYLLPQEMPDYLGAGSEFITIKSVPHYENEVLKLDEFSNDTTLVGYIFGGISSTDRNIFFTNTGSQSDASNTIFKVKVIKTPVGISQINKQSIGSLQMQMYPNPTEGDFKVKYNIEKLSPVKITITTIDGRLVEEININNSVLGKNIYQGNINPINSISTYIISIETSYEKSSQKVIIKK